VSTIQAASQERATVRQRVWPINVNKSLLLIRVVVGTLFVGHGLQKTLGWFGGQGLAKWTEDVAKLGLQPAVFWARLEAGAEIAGGLLLVLGLFTAVAAAMIVGDMVVATWKVHLAKGLWSQQGGFEYNLVLIAILVAIGLMGPGIYSLDRRLPFALPRPATFIAALVVSIALSVAAVLGFGPPA
jgi:putative oxidoreductase